MNIYIGNISYNVSEEDLRHAFEEYGQVVSAKIIMDRYSGRSKGFGFIEMTDDEEGQKAISGLNGREFQGRELKVNIARQR